MQIPDKYLTRGNDFLIVPKAVGPETEMLLKFVENLVFSQELNIEESKARIEESVIELVRYRQHSSNGILITENGYFLTAYHCIKENFERIELRDHRSSYYPLERLVAKSEYRDIALVKARMPGLLKPKKYRIKDTDKLHPVSPICLVSRKGGGIERKFGYVIQINSTGQIKNLGGMPICPEHFTANIKAIPGDSGGIIVNPEGELVGIVSAGTINQDEFSAHSKILDALYLIDLQIRKLIRQHPS